MVESVEPEFRLFWMKLCSSYNQQAKKKNNKKTKKKKKTKKNKKTKTKQNNYNNEVQKWKKKMTKMDYKSHAIQKRQLMEQKSLI